MAAFKAKYPNMPVATTEPVADYMLQAVGADNMTPCAFQADIMNGTDPSAQDVAVERSLFTQHKVKVFVYNQQVTDSLTESFISLAQSEWHPGGGRLRDDAGPPGMTTSRGCWPRSGPCKGPWPSKISTEHL